MAQLHSLPTSSPVPTYLVRLEWMYTPPPPPQVGYTPPLNSPTSSGVLAPPSNGSQGLPVAGIVEKNVPDNVFPFSIFKPETFFLFKVECGEHIGSCFFAIGHED